MSSGVICKIWNIKGNTKGTKAQLKDSIDYIKDKEKTDLKPSAGEDSAGSGEKADREEELEKEQRELENEKTLGRQCKYVMNDIKTINGAYVGTRHLISADTAVDEMMKVKKFYRKTGGRNALHGVISLEESESGIINAPQLMLMCNDVLQEIFPDNQAVFAVHTNTENMHVHFIVNSVGLNGRKIHQDDKFVKDVLQKCVNKYARKYGFTPNLQWEEKKKTEYRDLKIKLRTMLDTAIESSDSFDDFLSYLKEKGYTVNLGKHISLRNNDMGKAVRTYQLGENYTKDAITERIAIRKLALDSPRVSSLVCEEQPDSDFTPVKSILKKYGSMDPEEKKYVTGQLRNGNNPWKYRQGANWQMEQIARQMDQEKLVRSYVKHYAKNGTLEGALKGILAAKTEIYREKKIIRQQMRKYKPILDIYNRMKAVERGAYLYEHQNIPEYRPQFEEYRELTRRLRDGYGKAVTDVAAFMDECGEKMMYADAQLKELSAQYGLVKRYGITHGKLINTRSSLYESAGLYEAQAKRRQGIFDMDFFYLASRDSGIVIRVVRSPSTDSNGRMTERFEITLMRPDGKVIEKAEGNLGRDLQEQIAEISRRNRLYDCKRFSSAVLAAEYVLAGMEGETRAAAGEGTEREDSKTAADDANTKRSRNRS